MDLYTIRNQLTQGISIFDIPLCVTYYARVSTEKDEQLHSLSAQVSYYSEFIRSYPNWTFVEGYVDEGISGTSVNKREAFLQMLDDARLGKFDFIVTKEISRFSRNTLDSIRYTQELLKYGVGVLFQSDHINTLMPDAELRLTIMSSIAQDEVRKISERVKFGFQRAIESGVVLGNNKMWGYDKEKGKLIINEKEAKMIQIIFDKYANEKLGMRTICKHLTECGYLNSNGNPFSFSTIRGIISNPKYKGYYCGGKTHKYDYKINERKYMDEKDWVMYKDEENVPSIVSEELWDRANAILNKRATKQNSENKTSYQNRYKYSGKIFCMEHKMAYHRGEYRYKSGNKEMWRCKKYIEQGKKGCDSPIIYTTELDEVIKEVMKHITISKSKIIHDLSRIYMDSLQIHNVKADTTRLKTDINQIMKMKDKLLDLSVKDRLSDEEFEIRNKTFNQEIENLQYKIKKLQGQELKNEEIVRSMETLNKLISDELDFDSGIDGNVIDALVEKIEVGNTNDGIKIHVYLNVIQERLEYNVIREKNNTSVCSVQYI